MGCNGDLKIIFFITNTLSWLVPGILLFSRGVGDEVLTKMAHFENIRYICFGLGMMFISTLGYASAITGHKKTINGYTTMTIMMLVSEIVNLARTCEAEPGISANELAIYSGQYMVMISHTVTLFINLMLSIAVAAQTVNEQPSGPKA